ncbi:MAG: hypothetical protein AAGA75_27600 [Cyanobacteria bacterium P01_E01_bin.6]
MPATAIPESVSDSIAEINRAACLNEWGDAIAETTQLIGNSEITSDYRNALIRQRRVYANYQSNNAVIDMSDNPSCEGIEPEPEPEVASEPSTLDWERAIAGIGRTSSSPRSSSTRTASSQSVSLPLAGSSCSSFETRWEATYHYWNGTAPADLDADSDGMACEHLPEERNWGGYVAHRQVSTRGYTGEVMTVNSNFHYLRLQSISIGGVRTPTFSTRSFRSQAAAREHFECYYSNSSECPFAR